MTKFTSVDEKKKGDKTVLTHYLCGVDGWIKTDITPKDFKEVIYLRNCTVDGDMFVCYGVEKCIDVFKGTKGSEFN